MIFDHIKAPYCVLQYYESFAGVFNTSERHYCIIVLSKHGEQVKDLGFKYDDSDRVWIYDLNEREVSYFEKMKLPKVFENNNGTFWGNDLREYKMKFT